MVEIGTVRVMMVIIEIGQKVLVTGLALFRGVC